ncbi:uncharacterized protein LOC111716108 [Eurytemora carolleeae]|uniref:uncharacterized protein LOC111716108 n=1 Tax=Eurytemora carolleeae TaxID=1294199 RepID=UPI000C75B0BF|nr:uncharacterized protein LOC111716108 [Eurytemora carolleeae]|eukprot:XP_023347295.1 uncharacterized protein LOC111716108 [Eurytemora affinis]
MEELNYTFLYPELVGKNKCEILEFLKDNKSTEFDNWLEDLEPDLNYYIEGIALLIICTFGIIGNIISILVLTSQDIDLKPSFANILICLVSIYISGIFNFFLSNP